MLFDIWILALSSSFILIVYTTSSFIIFPLCVSLWSPCLIPSRIFHPFLSLSSFIILIHRHHHSFVVIIIVSSSSPEFRFILTITVSSLSSSFHHHHHRFITIIVSSLIICYSLSSSRTQNATLYSIFITNRHPSIFKLWPVVHQNKM